METTNKKNTIGRRSFFVRCIGGAAGLSVLGSMMTKFIRPVLSWKKTDSIQVKIHPLAISRRHKERASHGS